MKWFTTKKQREKMEFIQHYVPTSKAQLLQVAMYYHGGNMEKAQEMFDFYNKNLELPDFDPVEPSIMQQVKQTAGGLFNWIKTNQGDLITGYQYIQQLIQNHGVLPTIATDDEQTADPLPEINV
jgi:hypothetical protein